MYLFVRKFLSLRRLHKKLDYFLVLQLIAIVLLTLLACTEDKSLIEVTKKLPVGNNTASSYRVVDSFNVGNNVYVRSLAIDTINNSLWVGTSVGVLEVDLATRNLRNTFTRDHGLANEYIFALLVSKKGTKWFGTNGGGLSKYRRGQWKTYFPMHGLGDYWVYSLAQKSEEKLWIGTWAGLSVLNVKTGKFNTYVKELVNEWVYALAFDSKDQLWIGTEGGLNMFDGKNWRVWTHADGLGAPNTQDFPTSPNTGLGTRTRHDLSVLVDGQASYNPNYIFSVLVTPQNNIWVGTWGGGAGFYNGKEWRNYTTRDGLASNIVFSIAQDKDDRLWFGTQQGLSYYNGESWFTMTTAEGLIDNSVYAIEPMPDGSIWVGSRNGVVLLQPS